MATKKAGAKGAKKSSAKGAQKAPTIISRKNPRSPAYPLYGRPLLDALKRGNIAEMRQLATQARAHVKEVNAALAKLDATLGRK